MGYGDEAVYEKVKGAKVISVEGPSLRFEDGRELEFGLEGDCCSSSTFTDEDQFKELVGATIQSIEERDGASDLAGRDYSVDYAECRSWHFLVFVTSKGHVTIDWHNDSNGYYDGWVIPNLTGEKV